ncbi:hypothetical protein GO730_06020 [Spirosoma sp. HMF3257]|uniref:Uncharacterized protein n=1 Tax=Spirosoma telluris TaxID=2183553 RepID=A0A327NJ40_9BACT|nr:hypothetical protein [Spirosoma telluris]RAI74026.1 hypothetical protein HMF3257_05975 [Spirosoma telluris]
MKRTPINTPVNQAQAAASVPLQVLLSQSEDGFYGSLQRIWNNVVKLEDMGIIQQENDKFMYAYRFAEAELKRAYVEQFTQISPNTL